MAKRLGNFDVDLKKSKKLKQDDNLDDLWGDDLDVNDVDDCFKLATQICEQDNITCTQRNNVSILPSYNAFKLTSKRLFTSTQSNPELDSRLCVSSSNKAPVTNGVAAHSRKNGGVNGFKRTYSLEDEAVHAEEAQFKKLQDQYLQKEGEVSILRSQLKEIRTNHEKELMKKEKEWADKLNSTAKQLNAVKSELDFKNLESANLKQKVNEVAKLNHLNSSVRLSQSPFFKQPKIPERPSTKASVVARTSVSPEQEGVEIKLQAIPEKTYPLQDAIPSSMFNPPTEEKYLIDVKNKRTCRNTIPFLQNQMSQDVTDKLIKLQPKTTLLDNDRALNVDYIYNDISQLMRCNLYEIEAEENYVHVNKLVCVSEQLLQNIYQFLQELEQITQVQNYGKINIIHLENKFQETDLNKSSFNPKQWCDSEMGIGARQSIMCISELLPYSSYLRGYLLENKALFFKGNEEFVKFLPCINSKLQPECSNAFDYLKLITSVLTIIKRLKKSHAFPGLLSAIAILLEKICLYSDITNVHGIIYAITREIVFCNPDLQVLLHVTGFLKSASLQRIFINNLCKMPARNILQIKHKERTLHFHQDITCVLQVLCVLLEDYVSKVESTRMREIYLNITKFVSNCIECNPQWLFYQEDKHCNCLCKIVELYVNIMYRAIKMIHTENKSTTDETLEYAEMLKGGIKTLHFLNFKVSDLLIKSIATRSQYKVVVRLLKGTKALNLTPEDVELLNLLAEEVQQNEPFSNVHLWN